MGTRRGDVFRIEGQYGHHGRTELVLDHPDDLVGARQADLIEHQADPLAMAIGWIAEHAPGALDALLVRTQHDQESVRTDERRAIDG
jgi:hypothetical protein